MSVLLSMRFLVFVALPSKWKESNKKQLRRWKAWQGRFRLARTNTKVNKVNRVIRWNKAIKKTKCPGQQWEQSDSVGTAPFSRSVTVRIVVAPRQWQLTVSLPRLILSATRNHQLASPSSKSLSRGLWCTQIVPNGLERGLSVCSRPTHCKVRIHKP